MSKTLSPAAKEQLAFALILLRDFKKQPDPKEDMETVLYVSKLARAIGVEAEWLAMIPKVPRFKIRKMDD